MHPCTRRRILLTLLTVREPEHHAQRYAWVVKGRQNLQTVRDILWQSLSLRDSNLLNGRHFELSPENNVYKLATQNGMRIYDTQPTFVYHASGQSNTWSQMKRPVIGRWTKKWPIANSSRAMCQPETTKFSGTALRRPVVV